MIIMRMIQRLNRIRNCERCLLKIIALVLIIAILNSCFPFDKRSKYYPDLAQVLMDKQLSYAVGLNSINDSVCVLVMTDLPSKRISVFKKGDKDKKWEAQYLNPSYTYCSSIACGNNLYIVVESEDGIMINRMDVLTGLTSNLFVADSSYSAGLRAIWMDKGGNIYQTVKNNKTKENFIIRIDSNFVDVSFVRKIPFDTKTFNELGYDSVLICRRLPEQDIALCYPKRERIIHELKDLRPIKATSDYLLFEKNNYHDTPLIIRYNLASESIDTVKVFENLYSFSVAYHLGDCFVGIAQKPHSNRDNLYLSTDNCRTWQCVDEDYMAAPIHFVCVRGVLYAYVGGGIFRIIHS